MEARFVYQNAEPASKAISCSVHCSVRSTRTMPDAALLSDQPFVAEHLQVVHKIGVTGGDVPARIAGANKSATYLLADVEVVATYKVYGVRCRKLEALIHKVFAPALFDLSIPNRFGSEVKPREWFLVPISAIDEAVERIRDGSIVRSRYDPSAGRLAE